MAHSYSTQTSAPVEVLGHRMQQALQVILAGLDERDALFGRDMEALRRELRLLLDHAGGDGIDVRNELAAQPHRIRRAGLLLFLRVGEAGAGVDQDGQGKPRHGRKNGLPEVKRRHRSPHMSGRAECG